MGSLHFLSIIMSDGKVNGKRSPEGRHLLPSPEEGVRGVCGWGAARAAGAHGPARSAGVLPLQEEGTHTRPMEVRSSKLHDAPALPSATGCPSEWSRSLPSAKTAR